MRRAASSTWTRGGVIDIADDWFGTECSQRVGFLYGASHAGDVVLAATRSGTSRTPITPLAPAMKIRTGAILRGPG